MLLVEFDALRGDQKSCWIRLGISSGVFFAAIVLGFSLHRVGSICFSLGRDLCVAADMSREGPVSPVRAETCACHGWGGTCALRSGVFPYPLGLHGSGPLQNLTHFESLVSSLEIVSSAAPLYDHRAGRARRTAHSRNVFRPSPSRGSKATGIHG